MTSDGFVVFWRSVQNILNIKYSYIGPVLEQLMDPKRGCSDFRRISSFNLRLCFLFNLIIIISCLVGRKDLFLGFVRGFNKYIAWPSTVLDYIFFYAILETERIVRVLEIFYLKVFSILFLIIFSMISIMNMRN